MNNKILQSSNISSSLYASSPRMVPANIAPKCLPIFIKVQPETEIMSKKLKQLIEKKPRKNMKDAISLHDNHIPPLTSSKAILNIKPCTQVHTYFYDFIK
jgi:hypothetical protein